MFANPWVRLVLLVAAAVGVLWILGTLREILTSFALGFALAYFLNPAVNALEGTIKAASGRVPFLAWHARSLAIGLLAVVMLVAVVLFLVVAVPAAIEQVKRAGTRVPEWADTIKSKVTPLVRDLNLQYPDEVEALRERALDEVKKQLPGLVKPMGAVVGRVFSSGFGIAMFLLHALVVPVFALYLMSDMNEIQQRWRDLVPPRHREYVFTRMGQVDRLLGAFVRGQLLVCFLMGIFYGLALTLCGLPMGLLVGFGTSFFSLVPYMSTVVGLPLVVVLSLVDQQSGAATLSVVAVYILGHLLEGHFITPKLMSGQLGLHPVVVLLAILVWGTLLGFVGMLIAVPVTAVLSVFEEDLRQVYLKSGFYRGGAA
jgi:predicted PurR-regulated permease PerM